MKNLVLVSHGDLAGERKMSDTESVDEVATLDSHSARLHRVRERLQGPQDRRVRSAIEVITSIGKGGGFSTTIKRFPERFNDNSGPAAAEGDRNCPVLLWLARQCHEVERITVAGVETAGREAVMGCVVGRDEELGSPHTRRFVRVGPLARVPTAQVGWTLQRESARTVVDERRDGRPQSWCIEDAICARRIAGVPPGVSNRAHHARECSEDQP